MLLSFAHSPQDGIIAQIGFLGKNWLALVLYSVGKIGYVLVEIVASNLEFRFRISKRIRDIFGSPGHQFFT